ncbi:MAG: response regulator [Verrucomicrobiaceae bacterium]|nr:response regulator [Verrucomicrobiaceae bacterium]
MSALDKIRILIVENEGLVGCDMAATLGKLDYDVVGICASGEEALEKFDELHPDLVLMDVHLAGQIDGIDAARKLHEKGPVAVVYVTACADLETVARARETQPHGYLLKPFNEDELRLTVEVAATRYLEDIERRRREHSYFDAFQSLADGVIAADLAGVVTFLNPAAARITGWMPQEAVGRSLNEIFRIFLPGGEQAEIKLADESGKTEERTVWLTTRHGERVAIQDRTAAMRDQRNSLSGLIILFRRLAPPSTAEAQAETPSDALAVSIDQALPIPGQQVLASPLTAPLTKPAMAPAAGPAPAPLIDVVESISDPLIALDGRWRLIYANGSAQRLFEKTRQALLGTNFWELLPAATREAHHEALAHAMLHREAVNRELYFEEKQAWLELRGYPFGEGLLLLVKDVTSRREEAERKSRMDRLESLGLLARGFAHDFNNLLTVLLGNLSLAEMRLRGNTERVPELQTAKQATLQAQSLVQQLLTFARGGAPIKRLTSFSELIEKFFQNHSRANQIQYRVEVQDGVPGVAVDPAQIRRLLGNLVRNAEQSMPAGGEIVVRCFAPDPSEMFPNEMVLDAPVQPTGVVIEVQDNGEGIAPEHLPHIFEPYFSTRKADNATGLGLTVCESIAKAHGGSISVRSDAGQGTSVRFYLPVDSDGEEVDALGLSKAFDTAPAPSSRILVLEDDPLVRSLITRNLTSQGFDVGESAEGSETVRLYQEAMHEGRPYDLVVLDLSIPNGMGGVRAMEKLRSFDPNVLAIVSSGYSDDPVMAKPAAYGFAAVLPKPYEPVDLLRLVKNVLSARGVKRAG